MLSVIDSHFSAIKVMQVLPSATQIACDIRAKSISPVEVAHIHLERIECLNPKLNAFVDWQPERVMEQACNAEKAVLRDVVGPLHQFRFPSSFSDVAGHRCEAGTCLRAGHVARRMRRW
jgi:Asp-tRNA(Asn)/Glu-tRNA(Gln) amidotransferase A subunit family amidase